MQKSGKNFASRASGTAAIQSQLRPVPTWVHTRLIHRVGCALHLLTCVHPGVHTLVYHAVCHVFHYSVRCTIIM